MRGGSAAEARQRAAVPLLLVHAVDLGRGARRSGVESGCRAPAAARGGRSSALHVVELRRRSWRARGSRACPLVQPPALMQEQAPSPGLARRRRVSRRSSEPRRSGYPASTRQLHPLLVQLAAMRLVAVLVQQLLLLLEPDVLLPDLRCGVGLSPSRAESRPPQQPISAAAACV